jgi:hypothetical protein
MSDSDFNCEHKVKFWTQWSEIHVRVSAEYHWQLGFHTCKYGEFYIMMACIHTISKDCNTFYRMIMNSVCSFVSGYKLIGNHWITSFSRTKPCLHATGLTVLEIRILGLTRIPMPWLNVTFSTDFLWTFGVECYTTTSLVHISLKDALRLYNTEIFCNMNFHFYWKLYLWHRESRCRYHTMEYRLTMAGKIKSFKEGGLDEEAL